MSTYHSVAHTHTHIQCSIARTSQCNWNNGKISHTGKRGNVEKRNMEKNNIFFFFYICSSGQMNRAGIKKEWITVPYHVYIHTFTKSKIMYHIDDISIPQATEKLLVRLLLYRWRTCIFDFCWINDFLSLSLARLVLLLFFPPSIYFDALFYTFAASLDDFTSIFSFISYSFLRTTHHTFDMLFDLNVRENDANNGTIISMIFQICFFFLYRKDEFQISHVEMDSFFSLLFILSLSLFRNEHHEKMSTSENEKKKWIKILITFILWIIIHSAYKCIPRVRDSENDMRPWNPRFGYRKKKKKRKRSVWPFTVDVIFVDDSNNEKKKKN